MEPSSGFFDYEALEAVFDGFAEEPEAARSGAGSLIASHCVAKESTSPPTDRGTTDTNNADSEDSLSEVWPGDIVGDMSSESSDGKEHCDGDIGVPGPLQEAVLLWEVVFTRVVVRTEPRLDAPVAGICSQRELVAEERDEANPDWVKLTLGRGFILKDGRKKAANLGILLQPFRLRSVPEAFRWRVSCLLRDAWVEARADNTFLKPQLIRNLRKAADDSISWATRDAASHFDLDAFAESFSSEVQKLFSEESDSYAKRMVVSTIAATPPSASAVTGGNAFNQKYYAPVISGAGGQITQELVRTMMLRMKQRMLPSTADVVTIVSEASVLFADQPSLVELRVPTAATLHVVGDIHGQYWDLMYMIEAFGEPSNTNLYLFNGDFVDRGRFSVEVAIALMAMKVAAPHSVHLNRGNHESIRMNAIYGFMAEVKQKYHEDIFNLFCQAFRCLPLATVVNDSVFVVHGGLGSADNIRLDGIAQLNRKKEPDENADELMLELLWSDPMESPGFRKSPRGGGVLFGPDVTQRFCSDNGLICIVRSHEMKQDGFEWHHENMCLTIFSAPNYCGICGNLGAVCDITPRSGQSKISLSDMQVRTFEATDQPTDIAPMGFF